MDMMRRSTPLAMTFLLFVPLPSWAIQASGYFVAKESCLATKRIRRGNPDQIRLNVGQIYEVFERNKSDGDYVRIGVPNAKPGKRWVALKCGIWKRYNCKAKITETGGDGGNGGGGHTFKPFFDDQNNPVRVDFPKNVLKDITPVAPKITPFGEKVLQACGGFGNKVTTSALQQLFQDNSANDIIQRLKTDVGCDFFAGCSRDQIIKKLVTIWSKEHGFKHVFCGEPGPRSMGGLHYHGRYLQMQENGWGGLLDPSIGREEIVPGVIYTIGIQHQWRNKVVNSKIKGYPYAMSAADLIVHGTRAYQKMAGVSGKKACLYSVPASDDAPAYKAVFVIKNKAIRTFYPDATPGNNPNCDSH